MKFKTKISIAALSFSLITIQAFAGTPPPAAASIPTLDESGLIGLSLLMGVVGLIAAFKKRKK